MNITAPVARDVRVGRLAQLVVEEPVASAFGSIEHLSGAQLADRIHRIRFGHPRGDQEQRRIHLAAKNGGDLRQRQRAIGQAGQAAADQLAERRRQRQLFVAAAFGGRVAEDPASRGPLQQPLRDCGAQVLGDEERIPLRLIRHELDELTRRIGQGEHVADHRADRRRVEPSEIESNDGLEGQHIPQQLRLLLGTEGTEQEQRIAFEKLRARRVQEFQGEGVRPLQVVEDQEHRALLGKRRDRFAEVGEQPGTGRVRGQVVRLGTIRESRDP